MAVVSEPERSSSACNNLIVTTVIVATVVALLTSGLAGCSNDRGDGPTTSAVVEQVVDGDTIDIQVGGAVERVRLIGIDTPESVARSVPVQCFGREASEALTAVLPVGTIVTISRDVEARDRYGRLLLYVHRAADGLFINRWLIEAGLADALNYEPNLTYATEFTRLSERAAAAGVGLWGSCDGPDQPLD